MWTGMPMKVKHKRQQTTHLVQSQGLVHGNPESNPELNDPESHPRPHPSHPREWSRAVDAAMGLVEDLAERELACCNGVVLLAERLV